MTDPALTEAAPAERATRIKVNPPVFFASGGLILAFVIFGAIFPGRAEHVFATVQAAIIIDFGWFYILVVAGFLLFIMFLMISRYGDVKLGPDESEAEYSYLSWFAMLFSAGMGIGLLFFGVAEPVQHYAFPPVGDGRTIVAAREALPLTFFHWGLHAWAVYIVVGLSLAYFAFRRGLPLTIRSALFPLIGDRIHGPIGHAVDIFAVLGTMFGVATSLGLGVLQVNAGFSYLLGLPTTPVVQLALIAGITGLATLSAAAAQILMRSPACGAKAHCRSTVSLGTCPLSMRSGGEWMLSGECGLERRRHRKVVLLTSLDASHVNGCGRACPAPAYSESAACAALSAFALATLRAELSVSASE